MTTLLDLLGRASLAFAAIVFVVAAANPHPVGAADSVPEMAGSCGACHGPAGRSSMTEVPSLAGQPTYYLTLQLTLFRDQQRQSQPFHCEGEHRRCLSESSRGYFHLAA